MRIYEINYTQADGRAITGQLYTADKVSEKLLVLEAEKATNITIKEHKA